MKWPSIPCLPIRAYGREILACHICQAYSNITCEWLMLDILRVYSGVYQQENPSAFLSLVYQVPHIFSSSNSDYR